MDAEQSRRRAGRQRDGLVDEARRVIGQVGLVRVLPVVADADRLLLAELGRVADLDHGVAPHRPPRRLEGHEHVVGAVRHGPHHPVHGAPLPVELGLELGLVEHTGDRRRRERDRHL